MTTPLNPEELAGAIIELADDRKALDIVQLDLRGIIGYTDYFVICTGRSQRQAKAIHDGIHLGMKQRYGELLRAEIANTVSSPQEVEEELRALFAALGGRG